MIYHYRTAIILCSILFLITFFIKRKPLLWILLVNISLIPFIAMLSGAIYSVFNGSGLVGDSGGIDSGLFIIVICFYTQWYIYIPAMLLLLVSFYKAFIKREKDAGKD